MALIAIGTSWGGLRALERILAALPRDLGCPIVVAQHRSVGDDLDLATALGAGSALPVADAVDKELLVAGRVYLAPADYHLLVEHPGSIALSTLAPVHAARPSIDVLFESAADAYGPRAAGVVLTGASADGAAGLARVRAAGGIALVQDPATAECPIMPAAAVAAAGADAVLPLDAFAEQLAALAGRGRG